MEYDADIARVQTTTRKATAKHYIEGKYRNITVKIAIDSLPMTTGFTE